MNSPVQILYLEDDPRDAELVRDKLQQTTRLTCELAVARDRAEYEAALARTPFDLILSDYSLTDYDGMAALALARSKQPDVPFILISGTLGEEQAVDCVVRGATDYLLKERLDRLVPAVLRAFAEAEERQKRRKAEASLRESEEQYRAMFELASVGVAQADPRTGQWLRVNYKMCVISGYCVDELLRMTVSEITYADNRQSDWEAFERVVRGEQLDCRLETRYVRKNGSLAWVNVNMTIIWDSAGQPARTIATIEDITQRKRTEEAMIASEVRYRRLFESAKDGILILNAETGMIVDVNPFLIEILGFSREEFLGKKVWELEPFKDIVANQDNFAKLCQKEYIRYEDKSLQTADGRRIPVEFVSNFYMVNHHR